MHTVASSRPAVRRSRSARAAGAAAGALVAGLALAAAATGVARADPAPSASPQPTSTQSWLEYIKASGYDKGYTDVACEDFLDGDEGPIWDDGSATWALPDLSASMGYVLVAVESTAPDAEPDIAVRPGPDTVVATADREPISRAVVCVGTVAGARDDSEAVPASVDAGVGPGRGGIVVLTLGSVVLVGLAGLEIRKRALR